MGQPVGGVVAEAAQAVAGEVQAVVDAAGVRRNTPELIAARACVTWAEG